MRCWSRRAPTPEHLRQRQQRAPLPRSARAKVVAPPLAVPVVLAVLGEVQAVAAALRAEAARVARANGRPFAQPSEVVAAAC